MSLSGVAHDCECSRKRVFEMVSACFPPDATRLTAAWMQLHAGFFQIAECRGTSFSRKTAFRAFNNPANMPFDATDFASRFTFRGVYNRDSCHSFLSFRSLLKPQPPGPWLKGQHLISATHPIRDAEFSPTDEQRFSVGVQINFDAGADLVAVQALFMSAIKGFRRLVFNRVSGPEIGEASGHCKVKAAQLSRGPTVELFKPLNRRFDIFMHGRISVVLLRDAAKMWGGVNRPPATRPQSR